MTEVVLWFVYGHLAPPRIREKCYWTSVLIPMGLTQRELVDAIHVPYQRVNDLVNGRRGMTPSTALRLAKYFGMTADFWMNFQQLRWDLYFAQKDETGIIQQINPFVPRAV
jgi:antitoxin HigA-1